MYGSSSFRDRGQVAVQLVSCRVLPPGLATCNLKLTYTNEIFSKVNKFFVLRLVYC